MLPHPPDTTRVLSPSQEVWADAIALMCPENPSIPKLAAALGVPLRTLQPPTAQIFDIEARRAAFRRSRLRSMLIWMDRRLWSLIGRLS